MTMWTEAEEDDFQKRIEKKAKAMQESYEKTLEVAKGLSTKELAKYIDDNIEPMLYTEQAYLDEACNRLRAIDDKPKENP